MKKQKNKKRKAVSIEEYVKAARKGNRLAEQELLGPGFHSFDLTHQSKKLYTRKNKHKVPPPSDDLGYS